MLYCAFLLSMYAPVLKIKLCLVLHMHTKLAILYSGQLN